MEQILEDYMQWLLILSMCFLSLDTAIVSAENRSPVNTESEMTGSQDEESIPVENESSMESDPESASEPNENTSTGNLPQIIQCLMYRKRFPYRA